MDDQTRTHCMLDLDKVADDASAGCFLGKWGRDLREELRNPGATGFDVKLAKANDRASEAEEESDALRSAIKDAIKDLEQAL